MEKINRQVLAGILAVFLCACTTVDYVGVTYPPTTQADVYAAKENIKRDYEVMGTLILDFEDGTSNAKIHQRILAEAEQRGADAVLLVSTKKVQSGAVTNWDAVGPEYWGWWETPPFAYDSAVAMTTYEEDLEVTVSLLKYKVPAS